MHGKKGRDYEHDVAEILANATNDDLVPLATGYNGQHSRDVDLLVDDGEAVHVFELKRTGQDAYTLHYDENDVQKDDLYGLMRFCIQYPRPTYPYAGVRFDDRSLALTKLYINDWPDSDTILENGARLSPIEASVTRSDNLRFYKPDLGSWPGSNLEENTAEHILETIGYQL